MSRISAVLIRHGATLGNHMGLYLGRTDQPLSPEGEAELLDYARQGRYPAVNAVFSGGALRCLQSAGLIYPGRRVHVVPELWECDFGDFEGKSYEQLKDDPDYRRWLDSGGTLPFPGGEDPADFHKRCLKAFQDICAGAPEGNALAIVCHGGTIMAILSTVARPMRDFYFWHTPNCGGFQFNYSAASGEATNLRTL
jgi:alpha-ribazole phosphatase